MKTEQEMREMIKKCSQLLKDDEMPLDLISQAVGIIETLKWVLED